MRSIYYCDSCNDEFSSYDECEKHELDCGKTIKKWCYKCGKTHEWNTKDDWAFTYNEEWHYIGLGRQGYGSSLDGSDVNFEICDDCLYEYIGSFTVEGREKIHNSGSNAYLPTEIWIREAKGELTDEEYEEYGMYSPRQKKAYQERFPVCERVKIYEYDDGSCGSRCDRGAFGNSDGSAEGHQTQSECFSCQKFKKRVGEIARVKIV